MSDTLNSIISIVLGNSALHARWLNTFSFLEYIGFRKIVKSQEAQELTFETLNHAVEEGRHALILKKFAIRLGGSGFDNYSEATLLCGRDATHYFQELDRKCHADLANDFSAHEQARMTYLYVTWLIELRALSVYGLYQEGLKRAGLKPFLRGLLAEEEVHLNSVEQDLLRSDPGFQDRSCRLKHLEESLYQNYLAALSREILLLEKTCVAAK